MTTVPEAVLRSVRDEVGDCGPTSLAVGDLAFADLDMLGRAGSPLHLRSVASSLECAVSGEVDYLAVRSPSGESVSVGRADHRDERGPGMLSQLCTHPELRGLGLGTALVRALEHRCRQRELDVVRLAVEIANVRARTLYERLGYETFGEDVMGWEQPTASGVTWYKTTVTLMRRKL